MDRYSGYSGMDKQFISPAVMSNDTRQVKFLKQQLLKIKWTTVLTWVSLG